MMMMCLCRFTEGNRMRDVDSGGDCTFMGAGSIWELSVLSIQFCCESKTAIKKSLFKK